DVGGGGWLRDGFGDDPAFKGVVGEASHTIVGYALYHDGYETDRGRRIVHLIDLYVQEAWRQRGIGKALVRRVADLGRGRGAQAMLWSVYKPNELAARFYERLGARYITGL